MAEAFPDPAVEVLHPLQQEWSAHIIKNTCSIYQGLFVAGLGCEWAAIYLKIGTECEVEKKLRI